MLRSFVQQEVETPKRKELQIGNIFLKGCEVSISIEIKKKKRLLEAVEKSLEESDEYQSIVNTIRNDHIKTARSIIKNPEILLILEIQLKNEFIKLSSFLEAAKVISKGDKSCIIDI